MAEATAQKVKLYKETYDFVERFNRDPTWKISLLNAIRRSQKKDHLGTPLIGYALIIFKTSPQFATSHGYKLVDSLRNGKFDEFANTLDSLFTQFWKRASDREALEQESNKYATDEIEHPGFISDDDHQELSQVESQPEGPAKFAEYENFAQSRIEQFHAPQIPQITPVPLINPPVTEEQTPGEHLRGGESAIPPAEHLGGEVKKAGQPPPPPPKLPIPPLTAEVKPGFQFKSILQPLKSLKLPTNISVSLKKFIGRNLTPLRIASAITGAIGTAVGYGTTNTLIGAAGGGFIGGSVPTLVKQRGFGQLVLNGFTKAGNAGGSFLSGISSGGGGIRGIRGGGLLRGAAGGAGKKAAILALLGFLLLSAFLVGFAPAPGTPGGPPVATGSASLKLEKQGPPGGEVPNGQLIKYDIKVTYIGSGSADIQITDSVPEKTEFVRFIGEIGSLNNRLISWTLSKLSPNQPKTISFEVTPLENDIWVSNTAEGKIMNVNTQKPPAGGIIDITSANLAQIFEAAAQNADIPLALLKAIAHTESGVLGYNDEEVIKFSKVGWWNGLLADAPRKEDNHPDILRGYGYNTCQYFKGCATGADVRGVMQFEIRTWNSVKTALQFSDGRDPDRRNLTDVVYGAAIHIKGVAQTYTGPSEITWNEDVVKAVARVYCAGGAAAKDPSRVNDPACRRGDTTYDILVWGDYLKFLNSE